MKKTFYKNFIIYPEKKEIKLSSKSRTETYTVKDLYLYLMDVFDGPEYMRYDIPIEAISKSKFKLVNGWTIDPKAKKYLKGNLQEDVVS